MLHTSVLVTVSIRALCRLSLSTCVSAQHNTAVSVSVESDSIYRAFNGAGIRTADTDCLQWQVSRQVSPTQCAALAGPMFLAA